MMVSEEVPPKREPNRLGWRPVVLLAAFALMMFLPGFFTLPPIDRDEARFAQASRQMIESNDFTDIRYQETARYKKPIGIYWLQVASVTALRALLGEPSTQGIWPYRIPSLVAAVSSVVVTAAVGAIVFGRQAGIIAGLLMALSLILNVEARIATTDAVLLLSVLASHYALARACFDNGDNTATTLPIGTLLACWAGFALGVLVKGPIVALVVSGTVAVLIWRGSGASRLLRVRPVLGLLITCLLVLPWLLLVTLRSQGAFLQESVGQDLIGKLFDAETAGRLPPGMHLLMFWLAFWPGSLLVVLAMPWVWASRRDARVGFCLAWAIPTWILFELPMTKLIHYTLPAFPALAMLTAAWLISGTERAWPTLLRRVAAIGWALLSAGVCATIAALPFVMDGRLTILPVLLSILAAVLLAAAALCVLTRPMTALAMMLLSGPVVFVAAATSLPGLEKPFVSRSLARLLPGIAPCPMPDLASAGYEEPSLVFLTSSKIQFLSGRALAEWLATRQCAVAIVEGRLEAEFQERSRQLAHQSRPVATIQGVNLANSRTVTLSVHVRDPR